MQNFGQIMPRECGGAFVSFVIPGRRNAANPESRTSGFVLRTPRNDKEDALLPPSLAMTGREPPCYRRKLLISDTLPSR